MLPAALVRHATAGRLRVTVPSKIGDPAYFDRVVTALQKLPQVTVAKANPTTGSVLLTHRGKEGSLFGAAEKAQLFRVQLPPPRPSTLAREEAVTSFRVSSMLSAELAGVAGLVLLGLGAYQATRSKFLPAGLTLFFQAAELLAVSQQA